MANELGHALAIRCDFIEAPLHQEESGKVAVNELHV